MATEWLGLGPFDQPRRRKPSRLTSMTLTSATVLSTINTLGVTASQILSVLSWYRGKVTPATLDRGDAGGRRRRGRRGRGATVAWPPASSHARAPTARFALAEVAADVLAPIGVSLADPERQSPPTISSRMCQALGISPLPTRKQERIDAISEHFADPDARDGIRSRLSKKARALLEEIAYAAGPQVIDPLAVGLGQYALHRAGGPRRRPAWDRSPMPNDSRALAALTERGIVGADAWDEALWIWREAWPLLERPLHREWPSVPGAGHGRASPAGGLRLYRRSSGRPSGPSEHWDPHAPAGCSRAASAVWRRASSSATAKALGTDEATVELVATAALSMGLMLPNVVKTSGRGRNRRVDEAWLADPEMRAAWSEAGAPTRWLRLVAEWTTPRIDASSQLVANRRLLLLRKLAALEEGVGWRDDTEVAAWIQHRYAPVAVDEAVAACLSRDLRILGMVTAEGPVALTGLGRLALDDPVAVEKADLGSADTAVVQADETVVCPPDLDADLAVRLGDLAVLESDAGARIFRLERDG
ncbi:MAG: hypothetical protein U5R31_05200 [Acidimicrobiia bacterium]|nr:hypothetical protein [Acidimicrobiia bacterium]